LLITANPKIHNLSLHDALPIFSSPQDQREFAHRHPQQPSSPTSPTSPPTRPRSTPSAAQSAVNSGPNSGGDDGPPPPLPPYGSGSSFQAVPQPARANTTGKPAPCSHLTGAAIRLSIGLPCAEPRRSFRRSALLGMLGSAPGAGLVSESGSTANWRMFSSEPEIAKRQMLAVVFMLTAFGHADGKFGLAEKRFVQEKIAALVERQMQAVVSDPLVRHAQTARVTAQFQRAAAAIDRELVAL